MDGRVAQTPARLASKKTPPTATAEKTVKTGAAPSASRLSDFKMASTRTDKQNAPKPGLNRGDGEIEAADSMRAIARNQMVVSWRCGGWGEGGGLMKLVETPESGGDVVCGKKRKEERNWRCCGSWGWLHFWERFSFFGQDGGRKTGALRCGDKHQVEWNQPN